MSNIDYSVKLVTELLSPVFRTKKRWTYIFPSGNVIDICWDNSLRGTYITGKYTEQDILDLAKIQAKNTLAFFRDYSIFDTKEKS